MQSTRIQIPSELFAPAESSTYTGTLDLPVLEAGPDAYRFAEPLAYEVTVSNTGDALLVAGTVTGEGVTACGRCLEDVTVPVAGEVEGYYLLQEPDPDDIDEDAEDFEVLPEDHIIDLEPLIYAAILVDLPLVPLCREDCAGLCPDCGANLNEQQCDCAQKREQDNREFEQAKNPFSVLRELDLADYDEDNPSS